ncbi:hypothetical protein [Marinicauda pacifica]|uniref:hypothetical protein n=1 Tax=Marinicauda pacifica TaxID=1133559 RepID=UPI0035C82A37
MTIRKRLDALEKAKGIAGPEPIDVIIYVSVKPKHDGSPLDPGVPCFAHVLAGPYGPAAELKRQDDESVEAFEARVEAARLAAHGRKEPA